VLVAGLLLVGLLAAQLQAQPVNEIRQHNPMYGEEPGQYWRIEPVDRVRILQSIPGQTFEFEAVLVEAGQPDRPGIMSSIVADAYAGAVTITVVGHDGHDYGAEDIGEINLSATGVTGTIEALTISGDFGAAGPMLAVSAGALSIGGDLLGELWVEGEISGPLTIHGAQRGDIACSGARDITLLGQVEHTGLIHVGGPYAHAIRIAGTHSGTVAVVGPLAGEVRCEEGSLDTVLLHDSTDGAKIVVRLDLFLPLQRGALQRKPGNRT